MRFVKTLFYSQDGFGIFLTDKKFSAKGHILEDPTSLIDTTIEAVGYFETSKKYGETFVFESYEQQGANYYFLVNMIKGINEVIAKDIIATFGDTLFDVIENNPNKLLSIKGVGEKKLQSILDSYKNTAHLKRLAKYLLPYGISNHLVVQIYNHFGENAQVVIEDNPYELVQIQNIGFKKADTIALKIGKNLNDENRIKMGVLHTISTVVNLKGSTCLSPSELFSQASEILQVPEQFQLTNELFVHATEELLAQEEILLIDDFYMLRPHYEMEKYIYDTITLYANEKSETILEESDLNSELAIIEKEMQITLADEQKEAIALANERYNIFSLCGYAGTGKSTISKILLQLLSRMYPRELIVCCSLSGVAANRIKMLTGFEAFTIHSLLKFNKGSFEFNEHNKLSHKVVLLDEASMVNVSIFHSLLKAINFEGGAMLILVGDIAQLPPIGAGDVFFDTITQELTNKVVLERIYRQKNKVLKLFASDIRKGQVPKDYLTHYDDFVFLATNEEDNNAQILQTMITIAHQYIDMKFLYTKDNIVRYISYFQVVTPMKNHLLGVHNLNTILQDILNPLAGKELISVNKKFRPKDKVIHLKNKNMPIFTPEEFKSIDPNTLSSSKLTHEQRIFNGQIGVITHIQIQKEYVFVFYPLENYIVWYKGEDLREYILDLAYALSGHKTQGSEFENVLIPMSFSHYIMLHNRLLYTMITRAKNKLILVGESAAFEGACKKMESIQRETYIKSVGN